MSAAEPIRERGSRSGLAACVCVTLAACGGEPVQEQLDDREFVDQWDYHEAAVGEGASGWDWTVGALSASRCGDAVVVTHHRASEGYWIEAHCAYGPYGEGETFEFQNSVSTWPIWCSSTSGRGARVTRLTRWNEVDERCVGVPLRGGPGTDCFLCGGTGAPCEAGLRLEVTCD